MSIFALLCLIFRDVVQARLVHAGTDEPLTKKQQQNRVRREDFWETVAERFNDATFMPHADMRGAPVRKVDVSVAPATPVLGEKLMKVWYGMRGPYTIAHNNFVKLGQHNGILSRFSTSCTGTVTKNCTRGRTGV